jgi:hypothetical protein
MASSAALSHGQGHGRGQAHMCGCANEMWPRHQSHACTLAAYATAAWRMAPPMIDHGSNRNRRKGKSDTAWYTGMSI